MKCTIWLRLHVWQLQLSSTENMLNKNDACQKTMPCGIVTRNKKSSGCVFHFFLMGPACTISYYWLTYMWNHQKLENEIWYCKTMIWIHNDLYWWGYFEPSRGVDPHPDDVCTRTLRRPVQRGRIPSDCPNLSKQKLLFFSEIVLNRPGGPGY